MSRWSNDSMAIGVGTREIVVGARPPRLPRLRKPAPSTEPVRVGMAEAQCFTEQGALDALRAALGAHAAHKEQASVPKRDACMVLDDFWANHAILHGDFRTLRASELEEIALAHFTDICGIDGESLVARFCVQRGGRALFASAISRTLHDGIHEVCASERVGVSRLKLCLPERLNRFGAASASASGTALLIFISDELMQVVMSEPDSWVAYDAQRLFPGDAHDAPRLAVLAENAFERSATKASLRREDCGVQMFGNEIDLAPFEARFAAAIRPAQTAMEGSPAHRLMEYAQ